MYDNRYQTYEPKTAEYYMNEMQRTMHEAYETQEERLLEYGVLGSMNVPVKFAPNNHPDLSGGMSPSKES